MLANKLMSALSGGAEDKLYVDDVFSAYTYKGNGGTQTINNGIDLAGEGGLVWTKWRSNIYGSAGHSLTDTITGLTNSLSTNASDGHDTQTTSITSVSSTGYSVGSSAFVNGYNTGAPNYVSWTFRKSPKFFDVVTYTGNGVAGRQIPHALGIAPGMIIVKRTNASSIWYVQHRSILASQILQLNTTDFVNTDTGFGGAYGGILDFTVSDNLNASGSTYVAYLFAHDTSADGIIQCGSYVGNGSAAGPAITLGWEPQYVMIKGSSPDGVQWNIFDSSRGMPVGANSVNLYANLANGENTSQNYINPSATGFSIGTNSAEANASGATYIYLAIRRPNKPPTTGTEVYNHLTRTGSGSVGSTAAVGFAPDLAISQSIVAGRAPVWVDRLRGVKKWLRSDGTHKEGTQTTSGLSSFDMLGVSYTVDNTEQPFAWNNSGEAKHQRFFKRAPGFMDVVCYTGTGVARTVPHNLGVAPELMIVKGRAGAYGASWWLTYATPLGNDKYVAINSLNAPVTDSPWDYTTPTSSVFSLATRNDVNGASTTFVAYLFATLPGISKVGSYTGNGTTQTINCGFTTGSRFILIKRTDSTGDWYIWDTARGIVAGNDPHLSLNTTAAEVTADDSVDPDVSGFIVNQVAATNINVSGGSYIYFSVA